MWGGVFASQARKRGGREALAISEASTFVTFNIAEYVIYAVFVFGFITAIIGKPLVKFDQGWLISAVILYIIALGIAHGVRRDTIIDALPSCPCIDL